MSFDVNEELPYNPHRVGSRLWYVRERARLPKSKKDKIKWLPALLPFIILLIFCVIVGIVNAVLHS